MYKHFVIFSIIDTEYIPDPDQIIEEEDLLDANVLGQSTTRKRGRPTKHFNDLGPAQKRSKTNGCKEFFEKTCADLEISFEELLAFMGKRNAYEKGDFETGNFFKEMYQNGVSSLLDKKLEISAEKALYLR